MKKILLSTCLVLLTWSSHIFAQTADRKLGLGLHGGVNQYNGDHGNRLFQFDQAFYGFGGLSAHYYLSPSFNAGVQANYGDFGYSQKGEAGVLGRMTNIDALITYKFNNGKLLESDSRLEPFVTAGIGTAGYRGNGVQYIARNGYRLNDIIIPIGLGLKYHITPAIAVQYMFMYKISNHDVRDQKIMPPTEKTRNDHYAQQSIGIILSLGKKKAPDADGDGIADANDKCPGTIKGTRTDSTGCPVDSDQDGIADYLDQCPDKAGTTSANGCPDKDKDGIRDSQDKCPELAGKTEFSGCPDSDGDGIPDQEDACPKVYGKMELKGCLDTDGDGIIDSDDACPDKAGSKEMIGCPDRDKDGVPDNRDECPDLAGSEQSKGCPDKDKDGVVDKDDLCPDKAGLTQNKGCPEISDEIKKALELAYTGVQFESGSDIIKKTSYAILDNIVTIMKENPAFKLKISGHTDSQGNPDKNLELSHKRAGAVEAYIEGKGVEDNRILAKGYGSTMPLATNDTAEGRAKNRRVEFNIEF